MIISISTSCNAEVTTDDGKDFVEILREHGLLLKEIKFHDVEAGKVPVISFEVFPTPGREIKIEVPKELCEVRIKSLIGNKFKEET